MCRREEASATECVFKRFQEQGNSYFTGGSVLMTLSHFSIALLVRLALVLTHLTTFPSTGVQLCRHMGSTLHCRLDGSRVSHVSTPLLTNRLL